MKKLLLCLAVVLLLAGCDGELAGEVTGSSTPVPSAEVDTVESEFQEIILDENVHHVGETGESDNFTYRLDKVEKSQSPAPFQKEDFTSHPRKAEFDEAGNLINDCSYVILTLTIRNEGEAENAAYLSNLHLTDYDNTSYFCEALAVEDPQFHGRNRTVLLLQPGEEVTKRVAFIMEDAALESPKLYLQLDMRGYSLESVEDRKQIQYFALNG